MRRPRLGFKVNWKWLLRRLVGGEEQHVVLAPRYRLAGFHGGGIVTSGKVVKSYRAGIDNMAIVFLVETEDGDVKYIVEESRPLEWVRKVYPLVMDHIAKCFWDGYLPLSGCWGVVVAGVVGIVDVGVLEKVVEELRRYGVRARIVSSPGGSPEIVVDYEDLERLFQLCEEGVLSREALEHVC